MSADVDYYNPYTLLGNVTRAAIEAEGDLTGLLVQAHFEANAEGYEALFSRLAYTYGHIAITHADTMASASRELRPQAVDEFGTGVETIREALTDWEGDGAESFREYLSTIETALQYQYETAVSLENLLRLHGSLVLSAKEKIVFLAEQTVEELEERQQIREAAEAARLNSLAQGIITGVGVGFTVGGPWGAVVGAAAGLGGYVVAEQTRIVEGEDALAIIANMAESMAEVYEDFHTGATEISHALKRILNEHLTPTGSSVEGSPLVPRYLAEYLHGDADPNDVYNKDEWMTF